MGNDYYVFWLVGRAILTGCNPYAVATSFYPPATVYLFAILALLPLRIGFLLFSGLNGAMFFLMVRKLKQKRKWLWFCFSPAWVTLLTGQLDIFFFWLAGFVATGGWIGVVAATLLTLKPQLAFIVLPWFLWLWIRKDRRMFLRWLALTAALHSFPIILRPNIYTEWASSVSTVVSVRMTQSPGLFSLTNLGIPAWILLAVSIPLVVWALSKSELMSRTVQVFVLPEGIWYADVFLTGVIPTILLVPVSIISFLLAVLVTHNSFPFMLISSTALAWKLINKDD